VDQNNVAPQFTNKVQDYSATDTSVTYKGFKGLSLQAGILYLFDKDPPFSNQTARFNARGFVDRFYNPLGRVFTIAASYQFF
jgi:iron complex outermembrane receptor protein